MKKMKRLVTLLLAVMMVGMLSTSAFAASKTFVPTSGKVFYMSNGTLPMHELTFQATYNKKGQVKTVVSTTDKGYTTTENYVWKKGKVVAYTSSTPAYDSSYSLSRTFDKKGRLTSEIATEVYGKSVSTTTYTYVWNSKKSGTVTRVESDGTTTIYGITLNKNMKVASLQYPNGSAEQYTYFKNGNLKNYTYTYSKGSTTVNYNKKGYVTDKTWLDSAVPSIDTYAYENNKKKKAPSVITRMCTSSSSSIETYRIEVYTYKAVNQIRNCDDFGGDFDLFLGANDLSY